MSISDEHFEQACTMLEELWESDGDYDKATVINDFGFRGLNLARPICTLEVGYERGNATSLDDQITEDDEEILNRQIADPRPPLILYDILYSPTYQVPCLFIRFNDLFNKGIGNRMPSLDQVYDLLVPIAQRPAMRQVGVMGALSVADHPVSNLPAYFVHPCRTSEAMTKMTEGRNVRPIEYLLIWIGLIGASVGLNIPAKVAQKINSSME